MSDSTTDPPKVDLPPNVQITFRDDVTQPQLRQAVERSVATRVARFAEASKRNAAAQATRAELLAAVNAPLMRLIEEDPAAVEALYELRNQPPLDPSLPRDDKPTTDIRDATMPALEDARGARDTRVLSIVPPFDFAWSWVEDTPASAYGPPFALHLDKEDGSVTLDARSGGGVVGGQPHRVSAFAGFGVILTTNRKVMATCYASRRMAWQWNASTSAPDAQSAGVWAGSELTGFVEGIEIASSGEELVLAQASPAAGATASGGSPGYVDVSKPRSVSFPMQPGHEYTFDVGMLVESGVWPPGHPTAYAQVWFSGEVAAMSITREVVA